MNTFSFNCILLYSGHDVMMRFTQLFFIMWNPNYIIWLSFHIAKQICVNLNLCPLKIKCWYNANFVVTGGTAGCLNDNLQCHQWPQSWHYDNSQFSVSTKQYLLLGAVDWSLVSVGYLIRVDKMPTLWSLVELQVVSMTTCSATVTIKLALWQLSVFSVYYAAVPVAGCSWLALVSVGNLICGLAPKGCPGSPPLRQVGQKPPGHIDSHHITEFTLEGV